MEELSPPALCIVTEGRHSRYFHTLHFGRFDPDAALQSAQQYAHDRQLSVTDALLSLTTDMALDSNGGAKKLLMSNDSEMALALYRIFFRCPAMAARQGDVSAGRLPHTKRVHQEDHSVLRRVRLRSGCHRLQIGRAHV